MKKLLIAVYLVLVGAVAAYGGTVKHLKTCSKADGPDTSQIQCSDWNANLVLTNIGQLDVAQTWTAKQTFAQVDATGLFDAQFGIATRNATSVGGDAFNIWWTGSAAQLFIDGTNVGTFTLTSGLSREAERADVREKRIAADHGTTPGHLPLA
jgi:hypothetical protein